MKPVHLRVLALGATAFALSPGLASAAVGAAPSVADVPRVAVSDLGLAPSNGRINLAITLKYRNQAQLDQLVALQSNPASPAYHQFLTSSQFNAAFAPTAAQYAQVAAALQRGGFSITNTFSNHTVIDAVGTIGAAEKFFSTEIHRVNQPGYGERYLNARPGVAPASIASLVRSVDGLHNLRVVSTDIARAQPQPQAPLNEGLDPDLVGQPLKGPVSSATHLSGYGPLGFSGGYDLPQQHKIPKEKGQYYTGTGRASGVVIDADFLDSDLSGFLTYFNVTRTGQATTRIPIDGGPPGGDGSGDSLETTLDVETIVSNAPGTNLYVYEFPSFNSLSYITDAYNAVVNANVVDTANSSFGGCETGIGGSTAEAWDNIAEQGSALGITFHASSGDSGSDGGCVSAPASGPHFVAVGGTSLIDTTKGKWSSENAWNGSGGGVSTVFALPSYQSGVSGVITSGRNVPDVAFDANPDTGAAFYYGGSWNTDYNPLGGTSLASPIFGATLTEINELLGARSGYFNPTLYTFWGKNGYGTKKKPFFHDITSGSNGEYTAKAGFDQVTGIGSIDGYLTGKGL